MTERAPQLAVLGSPISHSKSPDLHRAAYRVLGLNWEYSAREVKSGELGDFFADPTTPWRGVSLTMPLKREVVPLLDQQDAVSAQVGGVNTVLFDGGRVLGFNTDVYGAERMLREAFPDGLQHAHILGGGATACSVALALANCGVSRLTVAARSPERASDVVAVAERRGLDVTAGDLHGDPGKPDLVVSTLPGTAELAFSVPEPLRSTVPLVDIAYDPSPTAIAKHWLDAGGRVVPGGLAMLVYQALAQVRIFVGRDPEHEVRSEAAVLAAMRSAAFDLT